MDKQLIQDTLNFFLTSLFFEENVNYISIFLLSTIDPHPKELISAMAI